MRFGDFFRREEPKTPAPEPVVPQIAESPECSVCSEDSESSENTEGFEISEGSECSENYEGSEISENSECSENSENSESSNPPQPSESSELLAEIKSQVESLAASLSALTEKQSRTEALEQQVDEKDAIIRTQYRQIEKFQEDLIWKAQKNLLLELISIADNVRMALHKQREKQDYDELLSDMESVGQWVDYALRDNGVNMYRETDADNRTLNQKRQTIVGTEAAPSPEQVGLLRSEQPGYEWAMPYLVIKSDVQLKKILEEYKAPQKMGFVIRPEEVIKLK